MHLKYKDNQAGLGRAERHVLDALSQLGTPVIHTNDLELALGFSRAIANLMLSRLCKKGWLQRLLPGSYRIVPLGSQSANPIPEDAWAIAADLFAPCYISGWTAAEHWELTEQVFNSTVVFTTKKRRQTEFLIAGLKYRTKTITSDHIFGIKKIWSSNMQIQIADIHRVIIDALDDPEIAGGGRHTLDIVKEYFQRKEANPELLCDYAEKLGHGAVFKRLGLIVDKLRFFPQPLLERLHSNIKAGIINLDPHGPDSGPIITKWGIRVNIPLGDIQ